MSHFGTNAIARRGFSTSILCSVASFTPACFSRGTIVVITMEIPGPPFLRRYFWLAKSEERHTLVFRHNRGAAANADRIKGVHARISMIRLDGPL